MRARVLPLLLKHESCCTCLALLADMCATLSCFLLQRGPIPLLLRSAGDKCGSLQASGVPTEFKQFDGTFHGFVTIAMGLPQSAEALKMSVQALRKAFGMA